MKFTSFIIFICFLQNALMAVAQKSNNPSGDTNNTQNTFLNDIKGYQDELVSQLESFKNNEILPNQMNQQLKMLNDILSVVNETQMVQKEKLVKFSRALEQTKLSLLKMLSEYENRIDQLEYNIMELKVYDPYVEKYKYPINKYWIKVDLANGKSQWKFEKSKNFISIKQSNDLNHLNTPATILILKHHKIIEGFVSAEILQKPSINSKMNHSAAGLIFHFTNAQNFRFVELAFVDEQAMVVVGEIMAGIYKRILSKHVDVKGSVFNTLTCKFENMQVGIFLNYEKIIELTDSEEEVKNIIGLFTRIGTANFKNIITGNAEFEKELGHKLQSTNVKNISKMSLGSSFRFAVKNIADDLSVYEIPHEVQDFDTYDESKHVDDVYPVPLSDSYYDDHKGFTLQDSEKHVSEKQTEQNICKEYSKPILDLQEWSNKNDQYNWKVINEYGITRMVVQTGIKNAIYKASLIYQNSACNTASYSVSVKLEYASEAGLIFRYDNKENMYIVTISSKTKEVVLKKIKNDMENIIKTQITKNINSFQRHGLHINDEGEKGTITIFVDNEKMFTVHDENYYKTGAIGLYVETGFAVFDTFHIGKVNRHASSV